MESTDHTILVVVHGILPWSITSVAILMENLADIERVAIAYEVRDSSMINLILSLPVNTSLAFLNDSFLDAVSHSTLISGLKAFLLVQERSRLKCAIVACVYVLKLSVSADQAKSKSICISIKEFSLLTAELQFSLKRLCSFLRLERIGSDEIEDEAIEDENQCLLNELAFFQEIFTQILEIAEDREGVAAKFIELRTYSFDLLSSIFTSIRSFEVSSLKSLTYSDNLLQLMLTFNWNFFELVPFSGFLFDVAHIISFEFHYKFSQLVSSNCGRYIEFSQKSAGFIQNCSDLLRNSLRVVEKLLVYAQTFEQTSLKKRILPQDCWIHAIREIISIFPRSIDIETHFVLEAAFSRSQEVSERFCRYYELISDVDNRKPFTSVDFCILLTCSVASGDEVLQLRLNNLMCRMCLLLSPSVNNCTSAFKTWREVLSFPCISSRVDTIRLVFCNFIENYSRYGDFESLSVFIIVNMYEKFDFFRLQLLDTILEHISEYGAEVFTVDSKERETYRIASVYCQCLASIIQNELFSNNNNFMRRLTQWMPEIPNLKMTIFKKCLDLMKPLMYFSSFADVIIPLLRKMMFSSTIKSRNQGLIGMMSIIVNIPNNCEHIVRNDIISCLHSAFSFPLRWRQTIYKFIREFSKHSFSNISFQKEAKKLIFKQWNDHFLFSDNVPKIQVATFFQENSNCFELTEDMFSLTMSVLEVLSWNLDNDQSEVHIYAEYLDLTYWFSSFLLKDSETMSFPKLNVTIAQYALLAKMFLEAIIVWSFDDSTKLSTQQVVLKNLFGDELSSKEILTSCLEKSSFLQILLQQFIKSYDSCKDFLCGIPESLKQHVFVWDELVGLVKWSSSLISKSGLEQSPVCLSYLSGLFDISLAPSNNNLFSPTEQSISSNSLSSTSRYPILLRELIKMYQCIIEFDFKTTKIEKSNEAFEFISRIPFDIQSAFSASSSIFDSKKTWNYACNIEANIITCIRHCFVRIRKEFLSEENTENFHGSSCFCDSLLKGLIKKDIGSSLLCSEFVYQLYNVLINRMNNKYPAKLCVVYVDLIEQLSNAQITANVSKYSLHVFSAMTSFDFTVNSPAVLKRLLFLHLSRFSTMQALSQTLGIIRRLEEENFDEKNISSIESSEDVFALFAQSITDFPKETVQVTCKILKKVIDHQLKNVTRGFKDSIVFRPKIHQNKILDSTLPNPSENLQNLKEFLSKSTEVFSIHSSIILGVDMIAYISNKNDWTSMCQKICKISLNLLKSLLLLVQVLKKAIVKIDEATHIADVQVGTLISYFLVASIETFKNSLSLRNLAKLLNGESLRVFQLQLSNYEENLSEFINSSLVVKTFSVFSKRNWDSFVEYFSKKRQEADSNDSKVEELVEFRGKRRKTNYRSKNLFIDLMLQEEGNGEDCFADLEDFIVA